MGAAVYRRFCIAWSDYQRSNKADEPDHGLVDIFTRDRFFESATKSLTVVGELAHHAPSHSRPAGPSIGLAKIRRAFSVLRSFLRAAMKERFCASDQ